MPLIAFAATLTASAQISPDTVFLQTLSFPARVGNGWIEAHWMEDGHRFWYVEDTHGEWRFHENDLAQKLRTPLLDNDRVRSAPAKIVGHELAGTRLPFNSVTLAPVEQVARFAFEGRRYALSRRSNELRAETADETERLETHS